MNHQSLQALLSPRSVAIIGASGDPAKIGGRPVAFLKEYGYAGGMYPVNPKYGEVQGIPCYPGIGEVDAAVDLAIVALPREHVLEALEQCVRKQVKATIVFSSGFAETGADGERLQRAVRQLARTSGMRILGPNSQGAVNLSAGSAATFSTSFAVRSPHAGSTAIISQSGAVAAMTYNIQKTYGRGIRYWIATGNEADIGVAECMLAAAVDPEVSVIQLYLEDCKDGPLLMEAAATARQHAKPVLALKSGRTEEGQRAAGSHTGALAGEDGVFDAVFDHCGIIRVRTVVELAAFSQMFDVPNASSAGKRVAILGNSGGLGVMMVDQCKETGLDIAVFSPETLERLSALLPVFASVHNPIDVTAQLLHDNDLIGKALSVLADDPNIDIMLLALGTIGRGYDIPKMIRDIARKQSEIAALIVVAWVGSEEGAVEQFSTRGVPAFADPALCVRAIAARAAYYERVGAPEPDTREQQPVRDRTAFVPDRFRMRESGGFLSEHYSKQVLAAHGFPVSRERLVHSADEAAAAARDIGYPVVLKISCPELLHKSDIGGVELDIRGEDHLLRAYAELRGRAERHVPAGRLEGILVQEMVDAVAECSLGCKSDPVFGPIVMVAAGGTNIELMKDFQLLIPPVSSAKARQAVNALAMAPVLQGARGRKPADIDALCRLIVEWSRTVADAGKEVEEMDLNPVMVLEAGKGVVIADAMLKLRSVRFAYDDLAVGDVYRTRFRLAVPLVQEFLQAVGIPARDGQRLPTAVFSTLQPWFQALGGRFPQGTVHLKQRTEHFGAPLLNDEYEIELRIADKYVKKGRPYMVHETVWSKDGRTVCKQTSVQIFALAEQQQPAEEA